MDFFLSFQIIVSILLIGFVILQSRGGQSGGMIGGFGQTYSSKKGFEKFLFWGTVTLAAIFASISILSVIA